jgi:CheY-like chemotaxis protein
MEPRLAGAGSAGRVPVMEGVTAMTRVLVVHHDIDLADAEVAELRRAGYEVEQCAGPIGGDACPVLRGEACWQVDKADVLVYDVWAAGDGGRELIEDIREAYSDTPVVLTSGGLMLDWTETEGRHQVTPAFGAPNETVLAAAVESAIRTAPSPIVRTRSPGALGGRIPRPIRCSSRTSDHGMSQFTRTWAVWRSMPSFPASVETMTWKSMAANRWRTASRASSESRPE